MEISKKLKSPRSFEEQLNILKNRNMIIEDDEEAIKILAETNYYRITAYALQFKAKDDYNNKVSFNQMYKLYQFDKKLRNLILGILESIEISLRTYMAYVLSLKYGSEAHMKASIFKDEKRYFGFNDSNGKHHNGLLDEINIEIFRNRKELLVSHHIREYDGHFPIWAIVEILSFGILSRMYSNLNITDQKLIAREGFNTSWILLESYSRSLSYIRNVCAHYGRLYNKSLAVAPKKHKRYNKYNFDLNGLFAIILTIKELTINKNEWETFKIQLEALIGEYIEVIDLGLIGFPNNWSYILNI